ncbi:MAG: cytochrome c oxidase subunit II [Anaerolineae bacterium]|nr:cytochrome c oxidase subunit II [Anaerolineae bacterium]
MSAETNKRPTNNNGYIWIVAAFVLLVFGGFVISEATPLLFPTQGSAESRQVDDLFKFMLVIGGAIFLLVQGLLVYSVIRFRAKPGDTSDGPPIHGNATLELVWTAIPSVIVLVLVIYSYNVWISNTAAKDNEQVVQGIGRRFAWSFTYEVPETAIPDDVSVSDLSPTVQTQLEAKNSFTITSNELHTYVGRPVKVLLNTEDNQHAFWIPAMRIKQDLLAGRTTEARFTPIEAGNYPIVCAELCGDGHGAMRAEIVVHPDEETYLAWFNDTANTVFYPPEDPVERGRQILASGAYPCSGCHTLSDLGWQGVTGPNLNGVGDRADSVRAAATGETPEEYLHRSIYFPSEYLVPGFGALMPQFQPDDPGAPNYMPIEDHIAIVAYLCTQTSTGESVCDLDNLNQIAGQ